MSSMSSFATDCVVQHTVYCSYCKFRVPKLYRYAANGKWHKIPKRCMTHPREIKFSHKYTPNDTALHRIVRPPDEKGMEDLVAKLGPKEMEEIAEIRLQAIEAIVQACPSVVSLCDVLGRTPLHLACMDLSFSKGAAELLVEACPMAASVQDVFGRNPLHYLIRNNKNIPETTVTKICSLCPKAASMHDKDGLTAISLAREGKERMADAFDILSNPELKSNTVCSETSEGSL